MIKATGRSPEGDTVLLLGLVAENVRRLVDGKPIHVHGQDVGMVGLQIVIFAGGTEESILAELTRHGAIDEKTLNLDHRAGDDRD